MNNRTFYTAIVNGEISEEVTAFAQNALEKLDASNARRTAKKQEANGEIISQILEVMESGKDYKTKEIAELVGISTSKASVVLRQMAENGTVTRTEGKRTVTYSVVENG